MLKPPSPFKRVLFINNSVTNHVVCTTVATTTTSITTMNSLLVVVVFLGLTALTSAGPHELLKITLHTDTGFVKGVGKIKVDIGGRIFPQVARIPTPKYEILPLTKYSNEVFSYIRPDDVNNVTISYNKMDIEPKITVHYVLIEQHSEERGYSHKIICHEKLDDNYSALSVFSGVPTTLSQPCGLIRSE